MIGTSAAHWFLRGFAGGIMLLAAINAASYFWLTPGYGDLVGYSDNTDEALGFPYEIWREGSVWGTHFVNYQHVAINLGAGAGLGIILGFFGIIGRAGFNQWVAEFEAEQHRDQQVSRTIQFSVKSLLFLTAVVAVFVSLLTRWSGSWEGLTLVYVAGPASLIGIAMFPDQIHWKLRAVIVSTLSLLVIGIALFSGYRLSMPLDRVMLGFFVCWTPQSVFAAFFITLGLIWRQWRTG